DAKIGAQHTMPIATNFKLFKYFSMSAGTSLTENWTYNTVRRFYDEETEQFLTEDLNGFDRFFTYNFNTSVGTTIYGTFPISDGEEPGLMAIRHVMTPRISYNINPAFEQYYQTVEVITADNQTAEDIQRLEYSRFEGSLFGAPNQRFSSSMAFELGNNIEAKVRSKDSTVTEPKKIKIFNNLNFASSYNFAAASLNFSPVRVTGGTTILNNKMSINFGAILDPYALDRNNRRIDKWNIDNGGSLFRMTSANINVGYTLSNEMFGGKDDAELEGNLREESVLSGGREDDLFGKPLDPGVNRINQQGRNNNNNEDSEFYNYSIPWRLTLRYALNYSNNTRENTISSHSLMFSGDVELSPNWSVGGNSGYDFVNQGFTLTQLRFSRKLLSWNMNFSWVPFGRYSRWDFFIGISSSLLSDLKYDKSKRPDQQL
ncbi:MAG: putative LPS assembly protein LptD, partial [Flavobacteriaceae bacterium]|nr:putative LPS assembly protein LptD [Flavobacteriaceae bacterium]